MRFARTSEHARESLRPASGSLTRVHEAKTGTAVLCPYKITGQVPPGTYKLEESKGLGKRSRMWITSVLPFRLDKMTGISPQNSQMS
jgi:hypothetical protein